MLTAGLWPNATSSSAVAEVLQREGFAHSRIDFEATRSAHARVVLFYFLATRREGGDRPESGIFFPERNFSDRQSPGRHRFGGRMSQGGFRVSPLGRAL